MVVLSRVHKRKSLGSRGEISGTYIYCDSGLLFYLCSWVGLVSVQVPCRLLGHTKRVLRQQYYRVLKLSTCI